MQPRVISDVDKLFHCMSRHVFHVITESTYPTEIFGFAFFDRTSVYLTLVLIPAPSLIEEVTLLHVLFCLR